MRTFSDARRSAPLSVDLYLGSSGCYDPEWYWHWVNTLQFFEWVDYSLHWQREWILLWTEYLEPLEELEEKAEEEWEENR